MYIAHVMFLFEKTPEKQLVILNFAGWAGQNKLYRKLYFDLIFDGRGARFL